MSDVRPGTYVQVHHEVRRLRGRADDHSCLCGEPARDWAYQHTGNPELRALDGSRPHSLNPNDYEPMCRSCHIRFDLKHDPALADRYAPGFNAAAVEALRAKWENDPEFAEQMRESSSRGGQTYAERMRTDSEYAERMRENNRRGGHAMTKRLRAEPELAEQWSETMRTTNSRRRRCLECGLVSNPGGIGKHRLSSGHEEYEDLP